MIVNVLNTRDLAITGEKRSQKLVRPIMSSTQSNRHKRIEKKKKKRIEKRIICIRRNLWCWDSTCRSRLNLLFSRFLSLTHPRPIVCPNKVGSFLPIRSLRSSVICRLFNCVATTRSSDQRPCLFVYARTFAMPSNGSAAKENRRKRDEMRSNINCQWC